MTSAHKILLVCVAVHWFQVNGYPLFQGLSFQRGFEINFKPWPKEPIAFIKKMWSPFGVFEKKIAVQKRSLDDMVPPVSRPAAPVVEEIEEKPIGTEPLNIIPTAPLYTNIPKVPPVHFHLPKPLPIIVNDYPSSPPAVPPIATNIVVEQTNKVMNSGVSSVKANTLYTDISRVESIEKYIHSYEISPHESLKPVVPLPAPLPPTPLPQEPLPPAPIPVTPLPPPEPIPVVSLSPVPLPTEPLPSIPLSTPLPPIPPVVVTPIPPVLIVENPSTVIIPEPPISVPIATPTQELASPPPPTLEITPVPPIAPEPPVSVLPETPDPVAPEAPAPVAPEVPPPVAPEAPPPVAPEAPPPVPPKDPVPIEESKEKLPPPPPIHHEVPKTDVVLKDNALVKGSKMALRFGSVFLTLMAQFFDSARSTIDLMTNPPPKFIE